MATVTHNGKTKEVKNLGWLLRHTRDVMEVHLYREADGSATLIAFLADRVTYTCTFADYFVAREWVHRPSLRGLPLEIWEDYAGRVLRSQC